jgi:SAM-dependent methyltransferase
LPTKPNAIDARRSLGWGLVTPNDPRTEASRRACQKVLALCESGLVLGLGGGPLRVHPHIVNLNIERYENVDVVGDAHRLPLASGCVDAVHCDAVFEHLDDPNTAAAELFRVMKGGAIAFVCTPFLQSFHGYPSHFQNFTHLGHRKLFERAGFNIVECGVCVGPGWAVSGIVAAFIAQYTPRWLSWPTRAAWYVVSHSLVRPLDKWLSERPDAYVVASTTYVLISKLQNSS